MSSNDQGHEEPGSTSSKRGASGGGFEAGGDEDRSRSVPASEPTDEPTDLTAGAPVREQELDQVHQRIPDTHQSGF